MDSLRLLLPGFSLFFHNSSYPCVTTICTEHNESELLATIFIYKPHASKSTFPDNLIDGCFN